MTHFIQLKSILIKSSSLLLLGLLVSCTKENTENLTLETLYVDEAIAPYFERFVAAGAKRGIAIDLNEKRIEGFLTNIEESEVVGQCTYTTNSTRKINIAISYWNRASDLEKEFVIFHELGHCYLERSHLDTQVSRTCTSIMHSGTSGCQLRYTTSTRTDYLDELFQE